MVQRVSPRTKTVSGNGEEQLEKIEPQVPINQMDLIAERREYWFEIPKFLQKRALNLLEDPRDIILVHLLWNIMITTVPCGIALFFLKDELNPYTIALGSFYNAANWILYGRRFILTLHFASHRRLFKKEHWILNNLLGSFVSNFFGIPTGAYYLHHVIMHHCENNVFPYDLSSTMIYQRDNFLHFLMYWARYAFAIWFQLPYYAFKRARYNLMYYASTCLFGYFVAVYLLTTKVSTMGTIFVFIVPFVLSSFLLMFGNYSQHIFVDPDHYADSYYLAYNIINTDANPVCYNDGYHLLHHLNSRLHWSELPAEFNKSIDKLISKDCITFHTIDFFDVGLLVFTKQWEKLASYYYNIN